MQSILAENEPLEVKCRECKEVFTTSYIQSTSREEAGRVLRGHGRDLRLEIEEGVFFYVHCSKQHEVLLGGHLLGQVPRVPAYFVDSDWWVSSMGGYLNQLTGLALIIGSDTGRKLFGDASFPEEKQYSADPVVNVANNIISSRSR